MSVLLQALFTINPREVKFARRGFACPRPRIRERLEYVGEVFLQGYHAALRQRDEEQLAFQLKQIDTEYRGFAYEGAAMALVLLDGISPGQKWNRFSRFLSGPGRCHVYMLHVGAGWACARLPWLRWRIESVIRRFHPVLGWMMIDGYGFHEGYFHYPARQPRVAHLSETGRHVFYQGLGRSLWFVHGADVHPIAQTIATFMPRFQSDAWSGVGLACAYAGSLNRGELEELRHHAEGHGAALAQGAAFAAKARLLAGNPAPHTELACTELCGMGAEQAAAVCDEMFLRIADFNVPSYEEWRRLVQKSISFSLQVRSQDNVNRFLQPVSARIH
jgi:enediyne biosynthesis protein E3